MESELPRFHLSRRETLNHTKIILSRFGYAQDGLRRRIPHLMPLTLRRSLVAGGNGGHLTHLARGKWLRQLFSV
jgi:hypothetical protein